MWACNRCGMHPCCRACACCNAATAGRRLAGLSPDLAVSGNAVTGGAACVVCPHGRLTLAA